MCDEGERDLARHFRQPLVREFCKARIFLSHAAAAAAAAETAPLRTHFFAGEMDHR